MERFLIASFLSVGALTFYTIPYEVITRVIIIPASIATTLFPAFSYWGVRNHTALQELFSRPFKYLFLVMVPIAVILVSLADEIFKFWLGEEFTQKSALVFQILTICFFFHAFAYVPYVAVQGFGRPDLKAKLDLIMLPIFVVACWLFITKLGLAGAALAKLFITLIDLVCLSWMAKSLARLSIKEMFGEKIIKAIIIATIFVLSIFSFEIISKHRVGDICALIIFTFVFLFVFIRIVMNNKDWTTIKDVVKYVLFRETRV